MSTDDVMSTDDAPEPPGLNELTERSKLDEVVSSLRLVDHHVHGALSESPSRQTFHGFLNEADTGPPPTDVDPLDSQVGFAVRTWCAPVLDLLRHAPSDEYWNRRAELGEDEVNRRFLSAAGVSDWFVDTGHGADQLLDPDAMSRTSGTSAVEIVRLETITEALAARQTPAADFPDAFRRQLVERTETALGTKSILAYRCGFDVDLARPSDHATRDAYGSWLHGQPVEPRPRLDHPTVIAFGIHSAIELGLPVQLHVGFGDRDINLVRTNPLLLTDFLRQPEVARSSIMLLHCYPFEREASYLAQAFPNVFLDVGLAMNYAGASAGAVLSRALEMAPFHKLLYSSDAYGPAELHYLGARLWRTALTRVLGRFVRDGDWSLTDAIRVARMASRDNATRAYPRLRPPT